MTEPTERDIRQKVRKITSGYDTPNELDDLIALALAQERKDAQREVLESEEIKNILTVLSKIQRWDKEETGKCMHLQISGLTRSVEWFVYADTIGGFALGEWDEIRDKSLSAFNSLKERLGDALKEKLK